MHAHKKNKICVAKHIIVVAKEITIVKETTKLSSFIGCYQNWMTYVPFSTKIVVVLIKVTFMTTTSTHYSYSRICD